MSRPTLHLLCRDERGLSTVEYILILVLVVVVGIVTWRFFGASVGQQVEEARGGITALDRNGSAAASKAGAGSAGSGAGSAGSSADPGASSTMSSAPTPEQAPSEPVDRDPEATRRGSLQAGAGRVTPLRSDGAPALGDASAGHHGGGWWKIAATLLFAILAMLASIPLLARFRKR
ncbi:MAG: hypothetical protein GXP55_17990 [Deltaproteobacteria bacterium]|nr:hypothetical protein [Deltaproteobacteria bacterium]